MPGMRRLGTVQRGVVIIALSPTALGVAGYGSSSGSSSSGSTASSGGTTTNNTTTGSCKGY